MKKRAICLVVLASLLSACASSTDQTATDEVTKAAPSPTLTVTSTQRPTITPTPTETFTPTPSATPTLASTPEFGAAKVGDDFLFGNQLPDCVLPCWQGLRVGLSNAQDVEAMFAEAFGFADPHNLIERSRPHPDLPSYLITSNNWDLPMVRSDMSTLPYFNVFVNFDRETHILEAFGVGGISQRFEQYTSPQHILRGLGEPSEVLVYVGSSQENPYSGGGTLLLFYFDKGIAIDYPGFETKVYRDSITAPGKAELCLASLPPSGAEYWIHVDITRPFEGGLDNLSPLQQIVFGRSFTNTRPVPKPLQEVFGIDTERLTQLAVQFDNACIYADVP